jgi:hypothetical protein
MFVYHVYIVSYYFLILKYTAEIEVIKTLNIKYNIPEKYIINVRSTQNIMSHSSGITLINKIPINIRGTAKIANFFQTPKTLPEKNTTNNKDADIKRGVKINKIYFSSRIKSRQENDPYPLHDVPSLNDTKIYKATGIRIIIIKMTIIFFR